MKLLSVSKGHCSRSLAGKKGIINKKIKYHQSKKYQNVIYKKTLNKVDHLFKERVVHTQYIGYISNKVNTRQTKKTNSYSNL